MRSVHPCQLNSPPWFCWLRVLKSTLHFFRQNVRYVAKGENHVFGHVVKALHVLPLFFCSSFSSFSLVWSGANRIRFSDLFANCAFWFLCYRYNYEHFISKHKRITVEEAKGNRNCTIRSWDEWEHGRRAQLKVGGALDSKGAWP